MIVQTGNVACLVLMRVWVPIEKIDGLSDEEAKKGNE
jgi:hypothetical protein